MRLALCLFAGLSISLSAWADPPMPSWPQWRGPLANGVVPNGNPPLKWDEQTNIRWKVRLPGDRGSSTPIVWDNKIFVLAVEDTSRRAMANEIPKPDPQFDKIPEPPKTFHRFLLLSYDLGTGKQIWRATLCECVPHEGHHPTHSFAGYSPVTDGQRVYAAIGSQGIYAYTLDGKPVWKRTFPRLETRRGWGEGGSPALAGNTLVVPLDQEGASRLVALDTASGKSIWEVERPNEPSNWSTPLIIGENDQRQIILNGTGAARAYELSTGKVIWEIGGQTVNAIPTPVANDKLVICMSGYRGALAVAVPRSARGNLNGSDQLWWIHEQATPYVPSPLLLGDRLYFTQGNNAVLTCLDIRSGKVRIDRARLPNLRSLYASPVAVNDRIYLVDRGGVSMVLRAGVDEIDVFATNRLDDAIDASPVVVGDLLLLRGQHYLYAIGK